MSRSPVSVVASLSVVISVTSSVTKPVVVVANEIVVDLVELEAPLGALCMEGKICSFLGRFIG